MPARRLIHAGGAGGDGQDQAARGRSPAARIGAIRARGERRELRRVVSRYPTCRNHGSDVTKPASLGEGPQRWAGSSGCRWSGRREAGPQIMLGETLLGIPPAGDFRSAPFGGYRLVAASGLSGKFATACQAANASHRVVLGRPHTFTYAASLRPSAARFSRCQAIPNFPERPLVVNPRNVVPSGPSLDAGGVETTSSNGGPG